MLPADADRALELPADEAVSRLLELPENQWFERKSGAIKATDFAVPLIAMANSEGGMVVVGLSEGKVSPVSDAAANNLRQAVSAIDMLMPQRRKLTESGRFEAVQMIPKEAWLEGLVNAVVHRSYSIGGDHIRVEIFPNRVEITSPGRFPGAMRLLDTMRMAQRPLGTGQILELAGLARPTVIRHLQRLRDAGLITWQGDSPSDPRATWHLN
ncbi:ArsR family transcriptional regulator [Leucobacter insecticola]|uniref:ArsR family transcriptional regulator n=1 Tax=Leucobacter insecticola TaxID=2714934 RepID=A0A6G8FIM3_9MICO|nr:ArsR family transcriptional regulator [Leucobacter insecticola]QIM15902.1 ArsR family transcriptional regulator [Leucobacter insecticola]